MIVSTIIGFVLQQPSISTFHWRYEQRPGNFVKPVTNYLQFVKLLLHGAVNVDDICIGVEYRERIDEQSGGIGSDIAVGNLAVT